MSAAKARKRDEGLKAARNIGIGLVVFGVLGGFYVKSVLSQRQLDKVTLCPAKPASVTVLLVDVTDAINLPQRQDFMNQLDRLIEQIPRYGKLVITKVDPVSDRLLTPVITRCNPGSAEDVSELNGSPQHVQKMRDEQFVAPIHAVADQILTASGADRSPILESVQSINLTELQKRTAQQGPRTLVVASDLLQNTPTASFYHGLPDPKEFVASQAFSRVRTDLKGTDVQLWMLQRGDSTQTQPRALPDLWERMIDEQGGRLMRVYTVSG